ncbi:MAG: hypothetical protein LBV54_06040 [Puniceicoccales bacterium]|jgi:predicted transcriptional regulator of viral defense system|nr:hypothetical protein [Puniceicoccales bacterium]
MNTSSTTSSLRRAFSVATVQRSRAVEGFGVSRASLQAATRDGLLVRIGRGLYRLPNSKKITANHTLAMVAQCVPKAVFCLLSALRFHNLTTQIPHEVYIALPAGAWRPRLDFVSLHIAHFSSASLAEGVESHDVEGVAIQVFSPAKTVADCFKFRNKLGVDVAIEALRETLNERRASPSEIAHFAKINRVSNVMRPYLESFT